MLGTIFPVLLRQKHGDFNTYDQSTLLPAYYYQFTREAEVYI